MSRRGRLPAPLRRNGGSRDLREGQGALRADAPLRLFCHKSSEHNAEYTPYFLREDELVKRYDVPVDEYIRRSEANLVEYAKTRKKLLAGESFPLERSVEYGSLIVHSV